MMGCGRCSILWMQFDVDLPSNSLLVRSERVADDFVILIFVVLAAAAVSIANRRERYWCRSSWGCHWSEMWLHWCQIACSSAGVIRDTRLRLYLVRMRDAWRNLRRQCSTPEVGRVLLRIARGFAQRCLSTIARSRLRDRNSCAYRRRLNAAWRNRLQGIRGFAGSQVLRAARMRE